MKILFLWSINESLFAKSNIPVAIVIIISRNAGVVVSTIRFFGIYGAHAQSWGWGW